VAINRSIYIDVHILCYVVGTTTFARTTTVPVGRGKVFVASSNKQAVLQCSGWDVLGRGHYLFSKISFENLVLALALRLCHCFGHWCLVMLNNA